VTKMRELSPKDRQVKASTTETTPPLSTLRHSFAALMAFSLVNRYPRKLAEYQVAGNSIPAILLKQ